MFVIGGRVSALLPDGFRLTHPGGSQTVIRTLGGGPEPGLNIGAEVEVHGGPSAEEDGVFLCSRIFLQDGKGESRRLDRN